MTDEALIEELARAMGPTIARQIESDVLACEMTLTERKFIVEAAILPIIKREVARQADFQTAVAYDCGTRAGQEEERAAIVAWLRKLDDEGGDINRFLPTTLANWIGERMHFL